MEKLDVKDMQGLLVRGYADLIAARFLMLKVPTAAEGRAWLASIAGDITPGRPAPQESAVNIAFTYPGLKTLGLANSPAHCNFSQEFISGMVQEHRSRALGDTDESAPANWSWGGPQGPVDVVLMLFAKNPGVLSDLDEKHMVGLAKQEIRIVSRLETSDLGGFVHFGFRDGISQPLIEGLSKKSTDAPHANVIKAGEFILGYPNEYGQYTERPMVQAADDSRHVLSRASNGLGDFGRNGTYLVFRTLQQDVIGFQRFLEQATKGADGSSNVDAQNLLAAKTVGRWRSGAPLVESPRKDNPALSESNDFTYFAPDPDGMRCPIGSHIRRSHPRDSLDPQPGSAQSVAIDKHHRILRRGREYGPPVTPQELADPAPPPLSQQIDRGLHFLCFAGNLSRQFEFIQSSWINSPKFDDLYDDADPLIGARNQIDSTSAGAGASQSPMGGTFTIPALPIRRRLTGLPRFVIVRGGAYFFMPGICALRYLAGLSTAVQTT